MVEEPFLERIAPVDRPLLCNRYVSRILWQQVWPIDVRFSYLMPLSSRAHFNHGRYLGTGKLSDHELIEIIQNILT